MARGLAEIVAVTLGHRGALVATADAVLRLPAIPITAASAVGAGDSFLAAMIFALSQGETVAEAAKLGLAAGAAAVLTPGTGLAHPADIRRLRAMI